MDNTKPLIAVTALIAGLLVGTNYMVTEEAESNWLIFALFLLGIAAFFYFWARRDQRTADLTRQAGDDAQDALEGAKRQIEATQQAVDTAETAVKDAVSGQDDKPAPPEPTVEDVAKTEPAPQIDTPPEPEPEPEPAAPDTASDEPDDLTRIEGIGPVYRDILTAQGVATFAQLAALSYDQIVETVRAGGGRRHASMQTWAEQAKLAAENKWDDLAALQEKLSGGRRE